MSRAPEKSFKSDTSSCVEGTIWTYNVTGNPYIMSSFGSRVGDITDGLSNTMAIAEDAGRQENVISPYTDPVTGDGFGTLNRRPFWLSPGQLRP